MAKWNPSQHPRDHEGKFTERGGGLRGTQRRLSVNSDENAGISDAQQAAWESTRAGRLLMPVSPRDVVRAALNRPSRPEDARARRERNRGLPGSAPRIPGGDFGRFGTEAEYDRVAERVAAGRGTEAERREVRRLQRAWTRA